MACKYFKAVALAELREQEMHPVELEGEAILLTLVQGRVHAFNAICTHGLGYLEDGFLDGYEVVCPLHQGAFDIRDGSPTRTPCDEPIQCYSVRVTDGDVYLALNDEDSP